MSNNDTEPQGYFPYASRDEKIDALKRSIIQSLDFSCHPDHLDRVQVKLDRLRKFWQDELKKPTCGPTAPQTRKDLNYE